MSTFGSPVPNGPGVDVTVVEDDRHAVVAVRGEIDQTTADGFVPLGDFMFAADGDEYVVLGDNTGTRDQKLVFDALRVISPDDEGGGGCGCQSSGSPGVLLVLLALGRRRRRVRAVRDNS